MTISALFLASGIGHLLLTNVFVKVTPSYVPWRREVVLITGVCEIVGALALLASPVRRVAGMALALFAFCVIPVHVDMLVHAERWQSIGLSVLWMRLAMQPILIWLILVVTKDRQPRTRAEILSRR